MREPAEKNRVREARESRMLAMFGSEARRAALDAYRADGQAVDFIHIEAPVSDDLGIFYTRQEQGGLVAVIRLGAISCTGMSAENILFNSRRIAACIDALPKEITIHSWMDYSPDPVTVVPEDWGNEFLAEQERDRNRMNAAKCDWAASRYIALEWRGDFSMGGHVGLVDMLKAGFGFAKSKVAKGQEREASIHKYNFWAYFKPEMQIRRSVLERIEREVLLFNSSINDFVAALTSEASGVGAYKEFGSMTEQMNSPAKILIAVERLNAPDGFKALYQLADPHPVRREQIELPKDNEDLRYGLHYLLGREALNFSYLLSIAKGYSDEVVDPDIRWLGESGPYLVGGLPRQIVAVRALPLKGLPHDLFRSLRESKVPFTVRVRWNGMTKRGAIDWVKKAVEGRRFSHRQMEQLQAKAMGVRFEQGVDREEGLLGLGTVLIALNGVPMWGEDGKVIPGSRVLRKGLEAVRKWAVDHQIAIDFLNEDQPSAHYAMLPGAWHLDPLEMIPIRSLTMGKLLPIYAITPAMPENTAFPGRPILTMRDLEGSVIQRGLEVGSVGSGAICGGMGSGKSYQLADLIVNFHRNEGRHSDSSLRRISIDCFEFGDGTDEGSSFNAVVRLLGGRVIQFGKSATSDVFNPFDAPTHPLPDGSMGYAPETVLSLTNLLVTMAGGLTRDGGSVTPEMEAEFRSVVRLMGQTPAGSLAGTVRSLRNLGDLIKDEKSQQLLAPWLDEHDLGHFFPSAPDTTRARVVNYNFPLSMDPAVRAVLFAAMVARMEERGLGTGPDVPKLVIGDEIGQGLKRLEPRLDATVESARRMLQSLYTNGRRYGMRVFIAFQEPGQILDMGNTLVSTIQNLCTTYFLYTQTDEARSKALFRLSDSMLAELRKLPPYHVGIVQQGLLTVALSSNPPYGHAARTTQPQERALRTAMMRSGKWGHGENLDLAGLIREMARHLAELAPLQSQTRTVRFDRLTREYEEVARQGGVG